MSNAERIALTRRQEYGYDEFNEETYQIPRSIKVECRGVVKVLKIERRNDRA